MVVTYQMRQVKYSILTLFGILQIIEGITPITYQPDLV